MSVLQIFWHTEGAQRRRVVGFGGCSAICGSCRAQPGSVGGTLRQPSAGICRSAVECQVICTMKMTAQRLIFFHDNLPLVCDDINWIN